MNNHFNHLLTYLVSMVKEAVNAFQAVYHRKALQKIRDLNHEVKYLYNIEAYLPIRLEAYLPIRLETYLPIRLVCLGCH